MPELLGFLAWLVEQSFWAKIFGFIGLVCLVLLLFVLVLRRNPRASTQKYTPAVIRWLRGEPATAKFLVIAVGISLLLSMTLVVLHGPAQPEKPTTASDDRQPSERDSSGEPNTASRLEPETTRVQQNTIGHGSPATYVGKGNVEINIQQPFSTRKFSGGASATDEEEFKTTKEGREKQSLERSQDPEQTP